MPDKISIQQLAAAIKRRDPRLAQVPDDELVRKVLERRPSLLSMIETSEPRKPLDLYGKIGSRLKSDLNIPAQAQSAANAVHEGLRNIREHGPSKMPEFLSALGQYKKPENVVGDALAALILGQAGGSGKVSDLPKSGEIPATVRTPATMESAIDMITRRGPGEPPMGSALDQQRSLVDNLRMRFERQKASNDPGMWSTQSKLKEAASQLREAELKQWGSEYQKAPQKLSTQGGGGANYTADQVAELKKKWGIK